MPREIPSEVMGQGVAPRKRLSETGGGLLNTSHAASLPHFVQFARTPAPSELSALRKSAEGWKSVHTGTGAHMFHPTVHTPQVCQIGAKRRRCIPLHTHGLSQARRRCGLNMSTYERDEIGYTEWRTLLDARFGGLESKVWCLHVTVESGAEGWAKQMPLFGFSLQYVPTAASLRDPN